MAQKEQKSNKRRGEDNDELRRNDDNNSGDGMPRFNFTWIYIIIALGLLGLQLTKMFGVERRITFDRFAEMARNQDVERLVVVNNEEAYVYIKKDKLGQGEYQDIKPEARNLNPDQPHFIFNIGTPEVLQGKLKALNDALVKEKKTPVNEEYETRTNWTGTLLTYLVPLLLFIGLWIFILRRMGGGAGGPGG